MTTEIVDNFLHRLLFATFVIVVLGIFANASEVQAGSPKVRIRTQSKILPEICVPEGALLDNEFIGQQLKLAELLNKPQLDNLEDHNQRESLPTARPAAWSQKSGNQASLGASPATSVNGHPRKEYLLTLSPEATQELDKRVREEAFRQEYNYQLSVHQAVIQHTNYKRIYDNVLEDRNSNGALVASRCS